MFDELDDRDGVPPGDLTRVLGRATALRRRRRAVGASSVAALSLVAGLAAVVRPTDTTSLRPVTTPASSPTESPSPLPSPVESKTPTPGRSPAAPAKVTPTHRPDDLPSWGPADGKPGWISSVGGCDQPPTGFGEPPAPGLRFTVTVPETIYRWWGGAYAIATIHNDSSDRVRFHARDSTGAIYDVDGESLSGVTWDYETSGVDFDIPPGESYSYQVYVSTTRCGDTPPDDTTIDAGDYTVAATIAWGNQAPYTYWVSERAPATVEDPDVERVCDEYSPPEENHCWTTEIEPEFCSSKPRVGADYGSGRGLRLAVTADEESMQAGEDVRLTVTISNVGDRTAKLSVYGGMNGSVLLDPSGTITSARRTQQSEAIALSIEPGGKKTLAVRAVTWTCTDTSEQGENVPPGQYTVRTGIYVDGFGWWTAPEDPSILVTP